ncbi:MAG: outer membrane protein transport protein, partial [Myxococcales bacterium]|nr:outer membrane protein transport protein [Myxococcales bacterium]
LASPFGVFGYTSRATAMGGAQGAAVRDHGSIFYNPANMVLRHKTHMGLSLNMVTPRLHIDSPNPDDQPELPETNATVALGLVFPLGGLLDYRVAIGIALSLPLIQLTRLEANDPARPYFYLYDSLPDHLVIAPALGFRIFDWLRLGIGVQILAAFKADFDATADVESRRIDQRSLAVDLAGATGVVASIGSTIGPVDIGVTFRDELELSYKIPIGIRFTGVGDLSLVAAGTALYNPRELNFGFAYHLDEPRLTLAADLTLAFWSRAPDPTALVTGTVDDAELRPDEEEEGTLFDLSTTPIHLGARDIAIPRFGAEWWVNDLISLRAGYFHRPAIVPDQTGYSNIMDSTANVFSLGGGATFPDPLHISEENASIDFHIQLTALNSRETTKNPADGAVVEGTYESGGLIWNVGIEFRQDF